VTEKKKRNRRSVKYPALDPHLNLRTRYEEIEDLASYANTLSDADKEWLNSFASEEICASFNHSGPKLNDQSDPKSRSRIYNRNNERNRCIMSREKAMNSMNYLDEMDIDNEKGLEVEESYE
jgi:hypothetical protein